MKKWVIIGGIITVVAVALIILVLWLLNSRTSASDLQVVETRNGWETLDYPAYGIRFKAPNEWNVKILELDRNRVSGSFQSNNTAMYLDITLMPVDSPDEQDLLDNVFPYSGEHIEQGELTGILYTGQVVEEGGGQEWPEQNTNEEGQSPTAPQFLENSYLEGRKFTISSGIIEAKCVVIGPDYESYVRVCNDILGSIESTQS